ncbi:urate oxidase [Catenulispora sp. NF23]|uniref:Uricase n=1 Tax=Catenulispora pinistramenti TaxID=2705254 RepID=A0ABS5KM78_9ACTN|nr:urate oxidase [Catenulispora pinistramenti]MBS2532120.1 urate oxidase [Catenulispora pinistramenti]MBS2547162.1 urate oxidase [Catenulispora pinistramenti]
MAEPVIAVLAANSYGKADVHLLKVEREGDRHRVRDLTVTTVLSGDFEASYLDGDNSAVLPTDSQKNTVHAFAADPIGSVEEFGARLARHFAAAHPAVRSARVRVEERSWQRLPVEGLPAATAFADGGEAVQLAWATVADGRLTVACGLRGIKVLKTSGSEFHSFLTDRYTTLAPTRDRLLATEVGARWHCADGTSAWSKVRDAVLAHLLEAFAQTHSLAVQQTLFAMGRRVLAGVPEVESIDLRLPNIHHVPVDLTPFGLEPGNEVFTVFDRPYGVIEGSVRRGAPGAGAAGDADFPSDADSPNEESR